MPPGGPQPKRGDDETGPPVLSPPEVLDALRRYWDDLDADFLRFYGRDLVEACWGPKQMGVRRLGALIARLPAESAFQKAVMGGAWSEMHEMVAALLELTHYGAAASGQVAAAHSKGQKFKGPDPKDLRIPRPRVMRPANEPKQARSREELRSLFPGIPIERR